jgi:transposase
MELDYTQDTKAPFNMAIATLMSLRQTLDAIRNIEGRLDYPPEERQRIKIELVKRFYVDSSPLIFEQKILEKFEYILDVNPEQFICVNRNNQKQKVKVKYSHELNKQLDECLLRLQIELQKKKYYMPPKDDMGSIGGKMS